MPTIRQQDDPNAQYHRAHRNIQWKLKAWPWLPALCALPLAATWLVFATLPAAAQADNCIYTR